MQTFRLFGSAVTGYKRFIKMLLINNRKLKEEAQSHSRLPMYKIPPIHKISLEDFEKIAIERLKSKLELKDFIKHWLGLYWRLVIRLAISYW